MLRQPRKLHYLKCHRCRNGRQKCTPTDRPRPGRKCDRCIKFGYLCSPSVTARDELARPLKGPQISQGQQPAPLGFDMENCNSGVDCTAAQFGQSGLQMENLSSTSNNTGQGFTGILPIERPYVETLAPDRAGQSCAKFFSLLKRARWAPPSRSTIMESEDMGAQSLLQRSYFFGKCYAIKLYLKLDHRARLVGISRLLEQDTQLKIAEGISRDSAVKIVTADLVADLSKLEARKGKSQPVIEYIFAATRRVREAHRWRELVDLFGGPEILLIDAYHPKCLFRSRKFGHRDVYGEFGDVTTLDCCLKGFLFLSIDRVVKKGTDQLFAKLKETLLTPELQLQVTCQRLGGLVSVIRRLFSPNHKDPLDDLTKSCDEEKVSDHDILGSEISCRVDDVFGLAPPVIESSNDEDSSDEDSSDKDDGDNDDEDCDADDASSDELRDRDQDDRDAVFATGFDEDFCIQFRNTEPFASLSSWPVQAQE